MQARTIPECWTRDALPRDPGIGVAMPCRTRRKRIPAAIRPLRQFGSKCGEFSTEFLKDPRLGKGLRATVEVNDQQFSYCKKRSKRKVLQMGTLYLLADETMQNQQQED